MTSSSTTLAYTTWNFFPNDYTSKFLFFGIKKSKIGIDRSIDKRFIEADILEGDHVITPLHLIFRQHIPSDIPLTIVNCKTHYHSRSASVSCSLTFLLFDKNFHTHIYRNIHLFNESYITYQNDLLGWKLKVHRIIIDWIISFTAKTFLSIMSFVFVTLFSTRFCNRFNIRLFYSFPYLFFYSVFYSFPYLFFYSVFYSFPYLLFYSFFYSFPYLSFIQFLFISLFVFYSVFS